MFWLYGPAGVGKSAVAQSTAEDASKTGLLGAAFFFSRPNKCDDSTRVIPTLAYRLAVRSPAYKRILTKVLADDPTIPEKTLHLQFKKLIIEPFAILKDEKSLSTPLLIIIDGLDECEGVDAQREFIELINEHVRTTPEFPLLWMVCSRPEWHFRKLLARVDFKVSCWREELLVDTPEAREDAYRVLVDGFRDIRHKYSDCFSVGEDEAWPSRAQLLRIVKASSGLFIFVSTILKFVGIPSSGSPLTELEICLKFIGRNRDQSATNPLHALDLLYRGIISTVPAPIFPITRQILRTRIYSYRVSLPTQTLANFISLSQADFYSALRNLYSVIDVPDPTDACNKDLHLYHSSFADFLKDPLRSERFCVNVPEVHKATALRCIQVFNLYLTGQEREKLGTCTQPFISFVIAMNSRDLVAPSNTWKPTVHTPAPYPLILSWTSISHVSPVNQNGCGACSTCIFNAMGRYVSQECWMACCRVNRLDAPSIIAALQEFPFCHLRTPTEHFGFMDFIKWLSRNVCPKFSSRFVLQWLIAAEGHSTPQTGLGVRVGSTST